MSATNAFETDLLELIFLNTAIANIGDTAGLPASATAGSLYLSLSTAAAADTMSQNTSEVTYTGYSRQAVGRSGANWTVTGDTVTNDNVIQFGQSSSTAQTATAVIIGGQSAGAGNAIFTGTVSLTINNGVNPQFAASALSITMA